MKFTNIPANYPIKAELCSSDSLRLRSEVPCDLSQETVEYAALRFLAHNSRLYHFYASESCKLRFAKGKASRRKKTFCCTAPVMLLELPGVWVRLMLRIDRDAITVTAITLYSDYPNPLQIIAQSRSIQD